MHALKKHAWLREELTLHPTWPEVDWEVRCCPSWHRTGRIKAGGNSLLETPSVFPNTP